MRRRTLTAMLLAMVLGALVATASPALAKNQHHWHRRHDPKPAAASYKLTPLETLGKKLFFDKNLSQPRGQSCAACHGPSVGFTGPSSAINSAGTVYPGAVSWRFGNRKPPTSAYGGDSPVLGQDAQGTWVGGMFWDGRATGLTLGDPLAEQAQGPFLNALEQNMPSAKAVCQRVARSDYAKLFRKVWGPNSLAPSTDTTGTYERIARSIAAYERSRQVNPANSKFDCFYDRAMSKGKDVKAITVANWRDYRCLGLSDCEVYGLAVFNDSTKGKCSLCHTLDEGTGGYPLFTDFTYDNLGVPKNLANPFYGMPPQFNPDGAGFIDYGLGGFLKSDGKDASVYEPELGKQKVPTLRNVDKRPRKGFVKAYTHNGYFKSLWQVVHFYNTRDVAPWPAPEYAPTVNNTELGNLGLTNAEEKAIVTFMTTLSDR